MQNNVNFVLISLFLLASCATTHRSSHAKTEFKHQQPCPATGKASGPCPGWIIDHINPLACGGADAPENMQWQTVTDAKAKDLWERKSCSQ